MMNSALQTIARVIATCTPIRIIETLLRIRAEKIGRISMGFIREWGMGNGESRKELGRL